MSGLLISRAPRPREFAPQRAPDESRQWGAEFRIIRRRLGFTQVRAAQAVGVTGQTICNWEAARSKPWNSETVLLKLAAAGALEKQRQDNQPKPARVPRKRGRPIGSKNKWKPAQRMGPSASQTALLSTSPGLMSRR